MADVAIDAERGRRVLWWSRAPRDYSRDRNVRSLFQDLGWSIIDFAPTISRLGHVEAWLRRIPAPDLVWVPCFRQRDLAAAARWSRRAGTRLVFDPLISAYDKQVFERGKLAEGSAAARRLLARERGLLTAADMVVADTLCHADYFHEHFGVPARRLAVIPVGVDEGLFRQIPPRASPGSLRVLFYGSFIGLQGPEVIVEAARRVPEVHWTLLGDGPLKARCRELAAGLPNVEFVPWVKYESLPDWIGQADVVLGIFGTSQKAGRVIPNKVFQPLACGRPVVTRPSPAYPGELLHGSAEQTGLVWEPPGDSCRLAEAVKRLSTKRDALAAMSAAARRTHDRFFCSQSLRERLASMLERLGFAPPDARNEHLSWPEAKSA